MTAASPLPDLDTTTKDDKRADWPWYWSHNQEVWMEAGNREDAIEQGSESLEPGDAFEIAQCTPKGPWPTLFADAAELCEFIDDQNEDNSFEDCFTEEAGISNADLKPLADAINALWAAFLEQHKPCSRALLSGPVETITVPPISDDDKILLRAKIATGEGGSECKL